MGIQGLVDSIVEVGGGYYTRSKIVSRVGEEQNNLLARSLFMQRVVELPTTAGILTYALPLSGTDFVREVEGAFFSRPDGKATASVPEYMEEVPGSDGSYARFRIGGVSHVPADQVLGGGSVTFKEDPLGQLVFLLVTVWPTAILTEDDNLTLPEQFGGCIEVAVLQRLFERGYGNADNLLARTKRENSKWSVFVAGLSTNNSTRPAWGFRGTATSEWRFR